MDQLQNKIGGIIIEAIAPGLIMMLLGSLVFFLADVFYQSQHLGRMFWVLGFWVFGIVLVCRIAITEDHDRSLLSGIPLAIVTLIAINRFVVITGPLASVSFFINIGFIVLTWWCASRLVWDCTLVDSSRDTTNKGLLQRIPWRRFMTQEAPSEHASEPENDSQPEPEIDGATAEEDSDVRQPELWESLVRMGRTPNTPGLSVVYFSLAAIPIFGFGQSFIPVSDSVSRMFSMKMFMAYAVAALCLLLVTSLLALHQYLLKRGVELPNPIAFSWIATGVGVVLVILAVAWMIPRPWAEYSFGSSPVSFVSPDDLKSSDHAPFGDDGPDDEQSSRVNQDRESTGDQTRTEGKDESDTGDDKSNSREETGGGKSEGKPDGKSKSESKQSQQTKDSKSGDKQSPDKGEKNGEKSGTGDKQDGKKSEQSSKQVDKSGGETRNSDQKKESESTEQSEQNASKESAEQKQNRSRDNSQQSESEKRKPQPERSKVKFNFTLGALFTIIKWLFYLAVILVAAYFAWRYREKIAESWRKFREEWKQFWERLFGQKETAAELDQGPSLIAQPRRSSFADFQDPFVSGNARKMSLAELVEYCFAAFEGWGNDNQLSREADQTPHEFAQWITQRQPELSSGSTLIADLYCQAVYSNSSLPVGTRQRLEQFWQLLSTHRIEVAPPTTDPLAAT